MYRHVKIGKDGVYAFGIFQIDPKRINHNKSYLAGFLLEVKSPPSSEIVDAKGFSLDFRFFRWHVSFDFRFRVSKV